MTAVPERFVVLLADDDENDVFLIRRAFKRLSTMSQLFVVPHGEAVIAYLSGEGEYADRKRWPLPRMLILDQWMPRLPGVDVLCWVRTERRFESLPVVILSGAMSPTQSDLLKTLKAAYCAKLIDPKEMVTEMEQAMASALKLAWETTRNRTASWFVPEDGAAMTLKQQIDCSQSQT